MASPDNNVPSSDQNATVNTLDGVGKIIRLLPTGTMFCYQILNPLLTNAGQCSTTNKILSSILFTICCLSCFFSTFTDSYTDSHGIIQYGIATFKGLFRFSTLSSPSSSDSSSLLTVDLSSYRLQLGDFAHGLFSLNVFWVISLLDINTVMCFYPSFASEQKALLMALPAVLGTISGTVFFLFPYKRHGIGYPITLNGAADQPAESSPPSNAVHPEEASSKGEQKV